MVSIMDDPRSLSQQCAPHSPECTGHKCTGHKCIGRLGRLLSTLGVWLARARERQALARLDDRFLRDMGINRYDAQMEARKPFWRE